MHHWKLRIILQKNGNAPALFQKKKSVCSKTCAHKHILYDKPNRSHESSAPLICHTLLHPAYGSYNI
jgi:hypothetical protein